MTKISGSAYLTRNEEGDWDFLVRAKSFFVAQVIQAFGNSRDDDIQLRLEVKRQSVPKSLPQLGYYFGGLIPMLVLNYRNAGHEADPDNMDLLMRLKYYSESIVDLSTGEEQHVPKTFKDITQDELSVVIEDICEIEFRQNFDQEPPNPEAFKRGNKLKSKTE